MKGEAPYGFSSLAATGDEVPTQFTLLFKVSELC